MADTKVKKVTAVKPSLDEMNAARAESEALTEQLRRLGISNKVQVSGSNHGDGSWSSAIPEEDYQAVRSFLEKRWNSKIKELNKVAGI